MTNLQQLAIEALSESGLAARSPRMSIFLQKLAACSPCPGGTGATGGSPGPTGPTGATGAAGDPGAPGAPGLLVSSQFIELAGSVPPGPAVSIGSILYTLSGTQRVRVSLVLHGAIDNTGTNLEISYAPAGTPIVNLAQNQTTQNFQVLEYVGLSQSAPAPGSYTLDVQATILAGTGTFSVDSPSSYLIVDILSS